MVGNQLSPRWPSILGRIVAILAGFSLALSLISLAREDLFRLRATSFADSRISDLEFIGPNNLEIAVFTFFSLALWSLIHCLGIFSFLRPQVLRSLFSPVRIAAFFVSVIALIYLAGLLVDFLTYMAQSGPVRYGEITLRIQLIRLLIQLFVYFLVILSMITTLAFCANVSTMKISEWPRLLFRPALIISLVSAMLMLILYLTFEQIDSIFLLIHTIIPIPILIATASTTAVGLAFRTGTDKSAVETSLTNWLQK